MAKKDNETIVATAEQRIMFDKLRAGRAEQAAWNKFVGKKRDTIIAYGPVDVTYTTDTGAEVGSVTESEPSEAYDYKQYFVDHPAEFEVLKDKYRKPATTTITVSTSWVESQYRT